eukprot:c24092_g1_i1 orf=235-1494(+)
MAVDGGSSSLKESGWLAAPQHAHTQKSMTQIAHAISVQGEDGGAAAAAGAWKWAIRNRIWDLLERENIAHFPRPVHHRIPNFVGAAAAAAKLASLPAFQAAKCVKVCPDSPQKQVRFLVLTGRKKLLTPQPRLRTGFFSELEAVALPGGALHEACTPAGAAKYGKPLGLDARIKVDLIVIGSVAVDPKTGARLGKGEGFAELEYGMLRYMGAIDDSTLVATSVHDKQLVDDISVEKLLVHDVPVDVICTPTQLIFTNATIPKPQGIYWEMLSQEKLSQIRVLQELKEHIEKETGNLLPGGPLKELTPRSELRSVGENQQAQGRSSNSTTPSIFVWNLNSSTDWKELRDHIVNLGGDVLRVNILRKQGYFNPSAQVLLKSEVDIESLVKSLDCSQLRGTTIRAKVDGSSGGLGFKIKGTT